MTRATAAEVEEQAALWVARMDGERWDATAEAELEAWIDRDPRHDGALLAAQAAWSMLDPTRPALVSPALSSTSLLNEPHEPSRAPRARYSRRWLLGGAAALAASLGLVAFGGPSSTRYATELGEIRRVPLADGSTAAINTASEIEVTLAAGERRVIVGRGEAWFQVAKDRARPFIVEAGPVRVRAVGTAFAVRRRDGGADVLVSEGVVEAWSMDAGRAPFRIEAGESAFIADAAAVEPLANLPSSVDRSLAWRAGKIELVGQPLGAAVAEFNRYNRRKLVVADPALASEILDGVFRTDDPAGFAKMVHVSLGVPVDLSRADCIALGEPKR